MDKLKPYAHLIGKVPDEKLADMAGLTLEELEAAKAALKAAEEAALKSEPKPDALQSEQRSIKALGDELSVTRYRLSEVEESHRNLAAAHSVLHLKVADLEATIRALRGEPQKELQKASETSAPPAELPAGKAVKVIKNARIKNRQGKFANINYGDIITGEEAAFLLTNYPVHVKVYG